MKRIYLTFIFILSANVQAYVGCSNVDVGTVQSASTPSFHGMKAGGATGTMIFIPVDITKCTAQNNEDLSNGAFLVIDDYETNSNLKSYWASMLLTAKASNSTITFHAYSGGGNNWGAAVLKPYFLMINK